MPEIRQLPPGVINKIAAGEVIERPASVIKELVENSVDAGARRIEVTLGQAGGELIRVADDGCGIRPEQLPLAVASHATSKIRDADDLFQVGTLGFRGEALASIAEVSRFRITSRTPDSLAGALLEVIGGTLAPVEPCGCGQGTTIEVRDLFFNTPVRRKFLRTSATEIAHSTEAFTRIALAYPDRHFVLRHNDRVLFDLPPTTHWPERIAAFFGADLGAALIAVSGADDAIRLNGFVADPNFSRGNNRLQYLFLNGRCIRDRALQHALGEAYRGLLLTGRFPIAFLRLDMPAELVDVNVHPTKMEVRFQDSGRIYSQLLGAIRRKFLATDLTPRVRGEEVVGKSGSQTLGPVHAAATTETGAGGAAGATLPAAASASRVIEVEDPAPLLPAANPASRLATGFYRPAPPMVGDGGDVLPPLPETARFAAHRDQVVAWAKGERPASTTAPATFSTTAPTLASATSTAATSSPTPIMVSSAFPQAVSVRVEGGTVAGRLSGQVFGESASGGRPVSNAAVGLLHPAPQHPAPQPETPQHLAAQPPASRGMAPVVARGIQLHNRYLVAESEDGMVVIDQHALHERILYEQLRAKVLTDRLEAQRLLVPIPVTLMPAECAAVLDARELLERLAFAVEPFGGDTVLVTSYPAMLGRLGVEELLRQVVDLLMAEAKTPEPRDLVDEMLHMMSCKAAVKAGDRLTPAEVDALLQQRHLFQDTHHCPHGRPTALVFTQDELDKRFKRI
ncbi:MAG: mismatch repair protein MutL [Planctomycetota bacterium]|jgi:DNA mismatch repair protein MutL